MRDLLFKDSAANKSFVVKRMRKGVREAVLHYQLLETFERENGTFSLVQIRLETGRSHQIRVQFLPGRCRWSATGGTGAGRMRTA